MKPIQQGIVNSLIWIISGCLVIIVRILIQQSTSVLWWEALGFGMVAYGATKLFWVLAKGVPTARWVP